MERYILYLILEESDGIFEVSCILKQTGAKDTKTYKWQSKPIVLKQYWTLGEKHVTDVIVASDYCTSLSDPEFEGVFEAKYNVPLLKSALQKSVRRCYVDSAVRIAWTLLNQSTAQLLRRLPIIMIEDAHLMPQFSVIVWFMMAATKGFKLTLKMVRYILKTVHDCAKTPKRDPIPFSEAFSGNDRVWFFNPVLKDPDVVDSDYCASIASLILRANYGGMGGDMEMLKKFAVVWYYRFKYHNDIWKSAVDEWISFEEFGVLEGLDELTFHQLKSRLVLKEEDKIPEGVDFHCYPNLIGQVKAELNLKVPDSAIKLAIWFNVSGINKKNCCCTRTQHYDIVDINYDSDEREAKGRSGLVCV